MGPNKFMIWFGAGALSLAGAAHAAVVTLNPTADAFVDSADPTSNYGAAGALAVSASGLPKGEFESLLKFDTSSAVSTFNADYGAGNWTITGVTLTLNSSAPNNAIFNGNGTTPANTAGQFAVNYFADDSWIEGNGKPNGANTITGAVTFANQPATTGDENLGTFNFPGGTSGQNTYALSLTSDASNDILAAVSSNPLSLRLVPEDSSVAYVFNSREFGGTAEPALAITASAVPEPAECAVLLLASASLARRHRRLI